MAIVLDGTNGVTTNSGTLISATTIGVGGATPSTSGAGITFPATQSASTDANTLDDYEEGTWTPSYTLSAGSVSGVTASGNYVKIGKQVTINFIITFTTASSAAINTVTGFPFTVANSSLYYMGLIRENSNTGYIWQIRATPNDTNGIVRSYINTDQFTSGATFMGSLTYFV